MSLGDFLDSRSAGAAAMWQPRILFPSLPKSIFSSPGLSLKIQSNLGGDGAAQGEVGWIGMGDFHNSGGIETLGFGGGGDGRNNKEEEHGSRSGSDNVEGGSGSGDDKDSGKPSKKKKRHHRHTPQQTQELEVFFKECPHPDEKQRMELSRRLGLEPRQVKFWYQNRRTQMKSQLERHENVMLRTENDKLRAENHAIREAMRNPICNNCGGPALLGDISAEHHHLLFENARLKEELDRVSNLAGKFLVRTNPSHLAPSSSIELAVVGNAFPGFAPLPPGPPDYYPMPTGVAGMDVSTERSMLLDLALSAMEELVRVAHMEEPLWIPRSRLDGGAGGGKEQVVLNSDEYLRTFPRCIGPKPAGFVTEATKETSVVVINSLALVETLMDVNRWVEMFPSMVARSSITDVICSGMGGTRSGALQLMHADLQVLSPLVPTREVNFLRFCKQHAEGVWAVVDVSLDSAMRENMSAAAAAAASYVNCRRLPSGCVVQDIPNGYSKVTWVEHAEYDERAVHQLYRPLLRSGMALGAQRWLATLQRQCESLAILMSSSLPPSTAAAGGIMAAGRRSMVKLAARMTGNFCEGVCASSTSATHGGGGGQRWSRLCAAAGGTAGLMEDVRVMTRNSEGNPGEPPGVVLSAATSVWLQSAPPRRVFDFLRDPSRRGEWDILSNGGPMQEIAHIHKGYDSANAVSLLRSIDMGAKQGSMMILQETSIDASGSLVVYAPVDVPAIHLVMNGGESTYVALLPSGFSILPLPPHPPTAGAGDGGGATGDGSLLTVAFQILVNNLPSAKLTTESVETVNSLISCTTQKIKASLNCEN